MALDTKAFKDALTASLKGLGSDLKVDAGELAVYLQSRLQYLARLSPSDQLAAAPIERDNALLEAGIEAARVGDAADARVSSVVSTILNIGIAAAAHA